MTTIPTDQPEALEAGAAESPSSLSDAPTTPQTPESQLEAVGRALEEQTARASVLEQELTETRRVFQETQQRASALEAELATALGRYRDVLLAASPEVPQELVQGETVGALDEALARAKALVERVRRQVEAQVVKERVPPGAPPRVGVNVSQLSPQDKILLGLRQLR